MKWNEVCHSRLQTKCCEENFHYYEVVFKAGDDLHGLRTEGCTPSLRHFESGAVWWSQRANHQLVIFCLIFGFGPFREKFLAIHWECHGVFRSAFLWLHRFDWEPPTLIDLPNCAAVDTELRACDELIEVWLDGWMVGRSWRKIEWCDFDHWNVQSSEMASATLSWYSQILFDGKMTPARK